MRLKKNSLTAGISSLMGRQQVSTLVLIFLASFAKAQDQTNFTQFYLNPYLMNPSYVGIDGQSALSIVYRKQWMTIEGAPAVANFSLQAPVSPRAGFGLSVTNDTRGLLNNSSILFTFGYNVALAEHAFIRFGISGGGSWNTVDLDKLKSLNDDLALGNLLENNASVTGNAGISFHIKTFQMGASMPSMFSPSYMSTDKFTVTEIKPFRSLIFNASNRFYFADDKHVFEPYVLYRMNADLPPQFEFAGIMHLNHIIWLGGSYKQDFAISALGGIKLKNMLAIGASYSLQNSGINELNSPSFEISINYLFGKRKKDAPLYSFVNTIKEKEKKAPRKSATQLIAEKRKAEEAARKKQQEELAEQKKAEALAQKAREEEQAREELAREAELAKNNPPVKVDTVAEAEKETPPPPVEPPVAEDKGRHETIKRGSHSRELAPGDYIIAGVFSSEANAQRYSGGLRKLSYDASYGHLTEKKLWYVYLLLTNDINYAKTELGKFRKLRMFKDAWLLTVEE